MLVDGQFSGLAQDSTKLKKSTVTAVQNASLDIVSKQDQPVPSFPQMSDDEWPALLHPSGLGAFFFFGKRRLRFCITPSSTTTAHWIFHCKYHRCLPVLRYCHMSLLQHCPRPIEFDSRQSTKGEGHAPEARAASKASCRPEVVNYLSLSSPGISHVYVLFTLSRCTIFL